MYGNQLQVDSKSVLWLFLAKISYCPSCIVFRSLPFLSSPYFVFLLSIWPVLFVILPHEYSNSGILISIRYISVFPFQRSTLSRTPTDIAALSLLPMTLVWIHLPLEVSKETDSECILYLFLSVYVFIFCLLGC